MHINIYAKAKTENGYELEGLLNTYFKYPDKYCKTEKDRKRVLESMKKQFTEKEIRTNILPQDKIFNNLNVTKIELVYPKKRGWAYGDYYAHEYDEYTRGRARLVQYSNGYAEIEVQCLDDSKQVLDGMWDPKDAFSDYISNGSGDTFTPDNMKGLKLWTLKKASKD